MTEPIFFLFCVTFPELTSQDEGEPRVLLPYTSARPLELFLPRGVAAAADLLMLLSRAVHEAQS